MLLRMSAEQRALFTSAQMEAIEEALNPRTHLVDLRMGLPLLGKGAYFVLVGGPDRRRSNRSQDNHSQDNHSQDNHSQTNRSQTNRSQADRKCSYESPEAMGLALSKAIAVNRSHQRNPDAYHHLLQRIPPSVLVTFEPAQIQAIRAALVPRRHLVDIRLSLPFFGQGAYLCFAAGSERRGHYRNIQNRNPFTMPAVIASILIGSGSILGLIYIKGSAILAKPDPVFDRKPKFYQTTVPFKKTQRECMESNRQWIEGKCVDELHDPTF